MTPNDSSRTASTANGEPVIEVADLRRTYGSGHTAYEAVRGVSFSVAHGELFALLGTNGAGKTSSLEVIEGLAPPNSGRVRVLGMDPVSDRRSLRPRMGIMLQDGGFPADLTAAETAQMWAGTLTTARPVGEALEMVDLGHRRDTQVKQLSGGERRRLDLALALLSRPEVLFLDEPTTGLDPESRRNTWGLVRDLLSGGTSVLLTTHYLDEAEELADRLAIMHQGRIVTSGSVAQVASSQPSTITFENQPGIREQLPDLPATTVVDVSNRIVLHTDHLQTTLTTLLTWAERTGTSLPGLDARSASLESAFLAVAGGEHDSGYGAESDLIHNDYTEEVSA